MEASDRCSGSRLMLVIRPRGISLDVVPQCKEEIDPGSSRRNPGDVTVENKHLGLGIGQSAQTSSLIRRHPKAIGARYQHIILLEHIVSRIKYLFN